MENGKKSPFPLNRSIIATHVHAILTGKSLSEALLFAEHGENMLCTKISGTISVHNMISPALSLEFSCIELVMQ